MSISSIGTVGGPFPSNYRSGILTPRFDPERPVSPELKARVAEATRRSEELTTKSAEMAEGAKLQTVENNVFYAPNASTLGRNSALQLILHMSDLIQSGVAERTPLQTGYGDKTTNNYHQYVDWLQQHVQELDAAGEATPEPANTGTAGGPFPADYVSEIKRLCTDVPGVKYEDWSPEFKQRVAEDRERAEALSALARELEERSKLQTVEVNDRHAPNVATLTKDQALKQIAYMTELIQSGEAEKTKLYTGYGDKLTNNYRQYVYWLQQHVKELEGAGQSTLAQA